MPFNLIGLPLVALVIIGKRLLRRSYEKAQKPFVFTRVNAVLTILSLLILVFSMVVGAKAGDSKLYLIAYIPFLIEIFYSIFEQTKKEKKA